MPNFVECESTLRLRTDFSKHDAQEPDGVLKWVVGNEEDAAIPERVSVGRGHGGAPD
jgi:hypothetical protein